MGVKLRAGGDRGRGYRLNAAHQTHKSAPLHAYTTKATAITSVAAAMTHAARSSDSTAARHLLARASELSKFRNDNAQ